MPSAAASMRRLFLFTDHGFDILFRLVSGGHHLMAAAKAFKPEISAGTQDLPLLFAARMGLLHHKDIIQLNVHKITPF